MPHPVPRAMPRIFAANRGPECSSHPPRATARFC
jgi:hypothetical protein